MQYEANSNMNREIMEFVVYVINETANRFKTYPSKVYRALEQSECINDYLVPFYDVLHTMGTQAIVDDVVAYMEERNFQIC